MHIHSNEWFHGVGVDIGTNGKKLAPPIEIFKRSFKLSSAYPHCLSF